MMTLLQFQETLRRGTYVTPPENLPARPMGCGLRAWWRFYVTGILCTIRSDVGESLKTRFTQDAFSAMSFNTIRAVEATGAPVEINGAESLLALDGKPKVFASSHMSLVETVILPVILGTFGSLTIVAKRSLSKYPLFGKCLKSVDPILLDRKSARHDLAETLSQGSARLREGRSVLLFPQGSRELVFNGAHFNSLATKLARTAGVPLVPVACKTDYGKIGWPLKDLGPVDPSKPVKYAIGEPLPPTLSQAEMQRACISFIEGKLSVWGCPCASAAKGNEHV